MISLEQKKHSRRLRKLISSDVTLSKTDRDKILDAINILCDDNFKDRYKQRMKVREIESLLNNNEHIQAKKGFFGMVKLYKKREVINSIFSGYSFLKKSDE